ncbi:MAG: ArsR/SmtB family transcription factor [Erythrobacter sp.]
MADEARIEALKAIAHPLRLRILEALSGTELNVGEIEGVAQIGQPALSQQLGVLRKARLVEARKQGKLVYYRLARARISDVAMTMNRLAGLETSPQKPRRKASPGAANFARLAQS